ncbi:hypothetical protein [Intrasporangium sp. YIM S08009]|uniref:hypothetical protein n=1 Tax=Intrasporangium zincisolvens TaxID=3080018 RepID=UPI002B05EAC6|nr:hypothetical protein [Intrasporangium sp. YIM S08009]
MSPRTDTPPPTTSTTDALSPRTRRFGAGLLLVGAVLVVVALGFQGQDLAVVFYVGFTLVVAGGVLAVVHHLRTGGGPVTVLPTSHLGWVAVAMLVVGVVASAVAPLVEVGSRHGSAVQNLAVQGGFVLAGCRASRSCSRRGARASGPCRPSCCAAWPGSDSCCCSSAWRPRPDGQTRRPRT